MIKNTQHNKKNSKIGGYAMLFAVVVTSIVTMIAMAMSNSAFKQIVLSSIVYDSQVAFYQAEMGAECALYMDKTYDPAQSYPLNAIAGFDCGRDANGNDYHLVPTGTGHSVYRPGPAPLGNREEDHYYVDPSIAGQSVPCFEYALYRNQLDVPPGAIVTQIDVNGYNSCNLGSLRTVQRTVQVTY